ncbi:hypothetical protein OY671_004458 [Metschnikowia pulcherrima]|nr:hypothetical protein OY671_004458 [Metschnikowia pulcherrima]
MDLRSTVDRSPRSGETVSATGLVRSPGGKGANQAVAAARLGRRVAMVGAVGDDDDGRAIRRRLAVEGLVLDGLATADRPTGVAVVSWEQPESTIVIEPGANAVVDEAFVTERADLVRDAAAVSCQCETPLGASRAVAATAAGTTVLNPAPAVPSPAPVRAAFRVLVPNRFELATLVGASDEPVGTDAVLAMVRALDHPGDVVVTLGADGALVVPAGGAPVTVPAERVDAVDTTAAGDSFCAALADGLLHGGDLVESARWAAHVAASTTTRHGAVDSSPRATDSAPEGTRIPLHS